MLDPYGNEVKFESSSDEEPAKPVEKMVDEEEYLNEEFRPKMLTAFSSEAWTAVEAKAEQPASAIVETVKEMRSHFSEQTILKTIAQAASAMAHCHHSLFLLHRDIKPANLFLTKSGDVKIGDFGLSKSLAASHGLAATKCGSPLYMSPELCSGRPYDRGCDVWALGCVMYEMMTLSPPWLDQVGPRGGMMQLMRLVTNGKVQLTKEARALYSNEACTLLAFEKHFIA